MGREIVNEAGFEMTVTFDFTDSYKEGQAGFAVLKAPDIPSILIETAFISNRKEEKNLKSIAFQQKLSRSILKGIKRYVKGGQPTAFYTEYE